MAGFDIEVTAGGDPLELLVGAAITSPDLDLCAVGSGTTDHIQALAALATDDPEITAACILKLPLLVVAAVPGILLNPCAIGGSLTWDISHLAAVADGQVEIGAAAAQGEHGVPVVAASAVLAAGGGPVGAAYLLVTHHLGDGAKVAHEVVVAVRVGVVEAVVHRRAELGYDRAVRASAEPGCDVADPLVVCHRAMEEGVGVEREQRRVEAAVTAQVPQVLAVASAADEHPAGHGRVVGAEPVGCDVAPLCRAVTARLVHWLEVHVGVRPVGADHGGPHGVPRGEVRYPGAGGVVRPKGEDDLESMGISGVNGAAVGSSTRLCWPLSEC